MSLYLPRAEALVPTESRTAVAAAHCEGQPVLLLEDNGDLRALAERIVESLGYSALTAASVAAAWKLVYAGAKVDLLLADVDLSGDVTGPKFADMLYAERPALPVVYMSGAPAAIQLAAGQGEGGPGRVAPAPPPRSEGLGCHARPRPDRVTLPPPSPL